MQEAKQRALSASSDWLRMVWLAGLGALVVLIVVAQPAHAETIDWTTIPRQGGGVGWNNPPCPPAPEPCALDDPGTGPSGPATQSFVNVGGTDVDLSVTYSGHMWDYNSTPNIYGSAAPVPQLDGSLRFTNNLADTVDGAAGSAGGPTRADIVFSEAVLLDNFSVVSLSQLTNPTRYEWVYVRAYDADDTLTLATSYATSTYLAPAGDIVFRPDSPLVIDNTSGLYQVRGTSQQGICPNLCGYDKIALRYQAAPIKRIELIHFATVGPNVDDPRSTARTSIGIEAIDFSVPVTYDWGDAPDTGEGSGVNDYPTLAAENGPRHVIVDGLTIGSVIDPEEDGQPTADADGDDVNPPTAPDDEDGVNPSELSLVEGAPATVAATVTNATEAAAVLYGWIDFDGDGVFEASERALVGVPAGTLGGPVTLDFGVTPTGSAASTFARFRLSTHTAAAEPTGLANNGEVEDYPVAIQPVVEPSIDWGDAPDTGAGNGPGNYNTTANDDGPAHVIIDGLRLGAAIDGEQDGQPTATANGDDANPPGQPDDEDGIADPIVLTEGAAEEVCAVVTNATEVDAVLYGWIDFNGNGIFELSERAQITVPAGSLGVEVCLAFPAPPPSSAAATFARFRLSTDEAASEPVGRASDGEVEDYPVVIEPAPALDWGDAPDTAAGVGPGNYNTLASDSGPSHRIVAELKIGPVIDAEFDGQQSLNADGDDLHPSATAPDDEDGVTVSDLSLRIGHVAQVRVRVTNALTGTATLFGWIDFDGNGQFAADERADVQVPAGANNSEVVLNFGAVPATDVTSSYARFRLSTDSTAGFPTGPALDGEVEDHPVTIAEGIDLGDAPDTGAGAGVGNYNTLLSDNGPSHVIVAGLHIGVRVDGENDGQPNTAATGDNNNPAGLANDEEGVNVLTLSLQEGSPAQVIVRATNTTNAAATLYGWIDFNGNGIFEPSERAQVTVNAGSDNTQFTLDFGIVPANGVTTTYARFRLSSDVAAATPTGRAPDGEVEDYIVSISEEPKAIDLVSFTASYSGGAVDVRWETSSEIGTDGFHLYRSTSADPGSAARITAQMVPAQGPNGGRYAYTDSTVLSGVTYYYWLVEVEYGIEAAQYGPTEVRTEAAQEMRRAYLPVIQR